jgi:peptide/nickel transport system substrate-binding protein
MIRGSDKSAFEEVGKQVASKKRVLAATGVALALGLTSAACGGGGDDNNSGGGAPSGGKAAFNGATTGVVNPSTTKGGTLELWGSQDVDSLDPVRGYYAFVWNLNRLYTRKLMDYASAPGKDGLKLVPDLAASEPEISADKTTYTFKLRDGLKFDDGTPITSKDIKYGIERDWAQDTVPGGPVYLKNLLDQGQAYPGPYKDKDPEKLGLKSVTTPDDKTITFKLKTADSDFPFLLAMPGAGPVPQKRDTGAQYGSFPASSGPYMFKDKGSVQTGKHYSWVRNPNWDPASDPIRKALPDAINLTITTNADDLDQRLLAGTADIDVGQTGVQAGARTKVLTDPTAKANSDASTTGFMRFAAIVQTTKPLDNIDCRKAIIYATDDSTQQAARGGPLAAGDIAGNILPLNIAGSDQNYDPFNMRQGKAQVDKAKQALAACGQPNGFNVKIAARNNRAAEVKQAEALQASLKAVGITATIDQYDGAQDSAIGGSPSVVKQKGYGIIITAWGADYPNGSGFLKPLADSKFILENGNFNRAEINDPAIDKLFEDASAAPDADAAAALYAQINQKVVEGAYYIPFLFDKALNYRNPRLTNVYVHSAFGQYDFQALGVSDGK